MNGIQSNYIRQRLFKLKVLDLDTCFKNARALEMAHKHADFYSESSHVAAAQAVKEVEESLSSRTEDPITAAIKQKCFFCGFDRHPRNKCPAKDATCNNCSKLGHWARYCRSTKQPQKSAPTTSVMLASMDQLQQNDSLKKSKITLCVGGVFTKNCLIDSGSSESFINYDFAKRLKLMVQKSESCNKVTMAATDLSLSIAGTCTTTIQYGEHVQYKATLGVIDKLCADVVMGHDILRRHEFLQIKFGGPEVVQGKSAKKRPKREQFRNKLKICPNFQEDVRRLKKV